MDYGRNLLLTDLYQLNMVEAYLAAGVTEEAVFEFFVRKLPPERGFLMAAGLEQAVTFLTEAKVSPEDLERLRVLGDFSEALLDFLAGFRFSGEVDALPEGTLFFPDEPVLRVTAPIAEAQLVETRLINFLHYQTLIATKAARMVLAAPGKGLVDFGLRRAHSGEAGLLAARAAYLAGFAGTASVPAAGAFGIPVYGTMAHSFVQTFAREEEAFLAFARARPDQTIFLLDTYDTERAAEKLVDLAPILEAEGIGIRGVRLDSGDLADHAHQVRRILDDGGLSAVKIVASGGVDEHLLARLTNDQAPIDLYGIGTSLVTSDDLPALDCAYKLKAYAGVARRKRSEGKAYWPGPTQVYRRYDAGGRIVADLLTVAEEVPPSPGARALLRPVLRHGALTAPLPDLQALRGRAAAELETLPNVLRRLRGAAAFRPQVSARLQALAREVDRNTGH